MRPDDQLLLDLNDCAENGHVVTKSLLRRAIKAIIRLKKQRDATKDIYKAAQAMYESTGVTVEMRNALQEYDRRRRPMAKWRQNLPLHGQQIGRYDNE